MSYSPVTFALGAFARNHCLKSLRSALSWARYDLTVLLEKSIFFPCGGFVFTYVESGSPLSCTIALLVSSAVDAVGPSVAGPPASPVLTPTASNAATADTTAAANVLRIISPPSFQPD